MSRIHLFLTISYFFIAGCAKKEETPEYFNRVTGLAICKSAKITNVEPEKGVNPGIDILYIVKIEQNLSCENTFLKQVELSNNRNIENRNKLGAMGGAWISVENVDGDTIVTYTE